MAAHNLLFYPCSTACTCSLRRAVLVLTQVCGVVDMLRTQALELRPLIQVSADDLQAMTQEGSLLSPNGSIVQEAFIQMILNEMLVLNLRMDIL